MSNTPDLEGQSNYVLVMLNNMFSNYNDNMRDYNNNISQCIQIIRNYSNSHPTIIRNSQQTPLIPRNIDIDLHSRTRGNVNIRRFFVSDDENISLTLQQITDATEDHVFVSEGTEIIQCPISLEDFTEGEILLKIKGCGHIFKKEPLMTWFQRSNKCPVCRFEPVHDISLANVLNSIFNQ
jgi:hypothetical protein